MIGVYATGNVSGAHLNPAVTAACVATSKPGPCTGDEGLCYAASRTVGAFPAACCNFGMYKHGIRALEKTEGAPPGAPSASLIIPSFWARGLFLTEIGSTAALLFGVNAIVDPELGAPAPAARRSLLVPIVGLLIFVTGPVSGCGMNPARDVGPRLVTLLASGASLPRWGRRPRGPTPLGPVVGAIVGRRRSAFVGAAREAMPCAIFDWIRVYASAICGSEMPVLLAATRARCRNVWRPPDCPDYTRFGLAAKKLELSTKAA